MTWHRPLVGLWRRANSPSSKSPLHPAPDSPHYQPMARVYKVLPPVAELQEVFKYNKITGKLYWRVSPANSVSSGDLCGTVCKHTGYTRVCYKKELYLAHRIIWAIVYKQDPGQILIDHINRIRTDNRVENLRMATCAQNGSNRPTKGAYLTRNGWRAQIQTKGKNVHLGYYSTEAEAAQAYQKAAIELKGQFYFPYA